MSSARWPPDSDGWLLLGFETYAKIKNERYCRCIFSYLIIKIVDQSVVYVIFFCWACLLEFLVVVVYSAFAHVQLFHKVVFGCYNVSISNCAQVHRSIRHRESCGHRLTEKLQSKDS